MIPSASGPRAVVTSDAGPFDPRDWRTRTAPNATATATNTRPNTTPRFFIGSSLSLPLFRGRSLLGPEEFQDLVHFLVGESVAGHRGQVLLEELARGRVRREHSRRVLEPLLQPRLVA